MLFRGKLTTETPVYRGNARKTLFTRDGDGTQRLVSLAGQISGTAQSLMDAFIGQSRNGRNTGLLNQLWQRLYGSPLPNGLITRVQCQLQDAAYPQDHFFDLRMGIKLDEDRWAAEANANYKMETVFRNAAFDFAMTVNDAALQRDDNAVHLYYVLQELREGRFWFGAGKSKGLGRVRLEMDLPAPSAEVPQVRPEVNHLRIAMTFDAENPVLVGWNWGKVDPEVPAFAAIEGRLLVEAMRDLSAPIRERLALVIGGPILSPENWKRKLAEYLPRTIAVWLQEQSAEEVEVWTLHAKALAKLGKGKYGLAKKVIALVQPLCEQAFPSQAAAELAFKETLGAKANMAKRILKVMTRERKLSQQFNHEAWLEIANSLGLAADLETQLAAQIHDEAGLTKSLAEACKGVLPRLYQQIDQQVALLQSDAWVDAEIANREAHLQIKTLLLQGKISEAQWGDSNQPPEGIKAADWRSFLEEHRRVRYRYIVHPGNLSKSITNDRNFITFLSAYRARARQELAQPHHIDFRGGGPFNRQISRKYGKPYDTLFMRMFSWAPSDREEGAWEIYIPGSTIKGAFRKRASQVLKTLWGESRQTTLVLDRLFGTQGRRGSVFFSDAYLADPQQPEQVWCSMDGVKMDPQTARPVESAKRDYLFAYGDQLVFQLQLDIQDISEDDLPALSLLSHLLQDFQQGDIPLGGEKTSGFGWVKAEITELTWLTGAPSGGLTAQLFGDQELTRAGIWHRLSLQSEATAQVSRWRSSLVTAPPVTQTPPRAQAGFISHRAFGGYCGTLAVEAQVLTPLHVRESGEPSYKATLAGGNVNGWDFFSLAPPEAASRPDPKHYALPSRSIKGMLRHIYAIASDSSMVSSDVSHLNSVDSLFGWVGKGPNQAIMGRLSFNMALFESPELAWFKVPYPYGEWHYVNGQWRRMKGKGVPRFQIAKTWRLFPHAPLAPIVEQVDQFRPDAVQVSHVRAILPGAQARFTIRFWNLEKEELQRLLWCIALEPELAHKLGRHRHVGFGSLRLRLLPESSLTDWETRYSGKPAADWHVPLHVDEWIDTRTVAYYPELRKALDAQSL